MLEHLIPHQTSLPPPKSAGSALDRHRPHVQRVPRASTVVGTIVVSTLLIVLALALVATMPAAVLAPIAILLVGGLLAAAVGVRAPRLAGAPSTSRLRKR